MATLQVPWALITSNGAGDPLAARILRLRNTTNFPDSQVMKIVRFCMSDLSFDVLDFDITLSKYRRVFKGKCYTRGCWMHKADPTKPLVTVRLTPKENAFPYWVDYSYSTVDAVANNRTRWLSSAASVRSAGNWGYISHWLLSREECLVHLLAHEIRHVWQINHKERWMRGSRGKKFSERDADAFAIRIVRAWRRRKAKDEADAALVRAATLFLSGLLVALILAVLAAVNSRRSE
jgi:hypothetical protein